MFLSKSQIDKLLFIIHQCIGGFWVDTHAIEEHKAGKLFNELVSIAHLVHPEEVTQGLVQFAANEIVDSNRQAAVVVFRVDVITVETSS